MTTYYDKTNKLVLKIKLKHLQIEKTLSNNDKLNDKFKSRLDFYSTQQHAGGTSLVLAQTSNLLKRYSYA